MRSLSGRVWAGDCDLKHWTHSSFVNDQGHLWCTPGLELSWGPTFLACEFWLNLRPDLFGPLLYSVNRWRACCALDTSLGPEDVAVNILLSLWLRRLTPRQALLHSWVMSCIVTQFTNEKTGSEDSLAQNHIRLAVGLNFEPLHGLS